MYVSMIRCRVLFVLTSYDLMIFYLPICCIPYYQKNALFKHNIFLPAAGFMLTMFRIKFFVQKR